MIRRTLFVLALAALHSPAHATTCPNPNAPHPPAKHHALHVAGHMDAPVAVPEACDVAIVAPPADDIPEAVAPAVRYYVLQSAAPDTVCTTIAPDEGWGSWFGGGGKIHSPRFPVPRVPGAFAAPEIDPASMPAALTLLVGGLVVARGRK